MTKINLNESELLKCIYCGSDAECREHVIPVSYTSDRRSYDESREWIVPACNTCNGIAGCNVYFTIPEKAEYILKKFKSRYRRILEMPSWTESELAELDYTLREMTFANIVAKRVAFEKKEYLETITDMPYDYKMPKFIKTKYLKWKKDYQKAIKNIKKPRKIKKR